MSPSGFRNSLILKINMSTNQKTETSPENTPHANPPVRGRSLFVVETIAVGVAVQTALLAEDNRLLQAPAVFPDVAYALSQIEELRAMVLQHFTRAAQVGVQVLASQAQQQAQAVPPAADAVKPIEPPKT